MSTPSPSPLSSPAKRPSLGRRPSSGNSLSPSTKPATHKSQRHYAVGAKRLHTRNSSHARALGKAGKLDSAQNLIEAGIEHRRQISSTSIPSTSPKNPAVKRNNSHAVLAKNSSHINLRKNKSAIALARNISHTQLHRKTGLAPSTLKPRKESSRKHKGFELGDKSTDEEVEGDFEEEEEWEDSATQSPKLTRSNSTVLSQPSSPTTSKNAVPEKAPKAFQHQNASSPKEPSLRHNQSAPNFGAQASSASPVRPPDPPANLVLLQHNPRSARAPPAVSSISAAARDPLPYNSSSFTHINHADTISSHNTSLNAGNTFRNTPNTGKSVGGSSSADGGVSHFLSSKTTPIPNHARRTSSSSDYDSPSSFLPHYHPQKSTSPEKVRMKSRFAQPTKSTTAATQHRSSSHLPSRTQQRLELQRRETMRAAAPTTPSTPLLIADGHRGSASAVSLHSRSGSQGRGRGATVPASAGAARLMIKQDYEAAERQLAVVRRFRNPVMEALGRLKEAGVLNLEKGPPKPGRLSRDGRRERDKQKKMDASMVPGRGGGNRNLKSDPNSKDGGQGTTKTGSSFEDSDAQQRPSSSPRPSRSPTRARLTSSAPGSATGSLGARKSLLRRQGSHDDIGLSRSQGSYEAPDGDEDERDGGERGVGGGSRVSAEEEMMRRMWESSEVYDKSDEG